MGACLSFMRCGKCQKLKCVWMCNCNGQKPLIGDENLPVDVTDVDLGLEQHDEMLGVVVVKSELANVKDEAVASTDGFSNEVFEFGTAERDDKPGQFGFHMNQEVLEELKPTELAGNLDVLEQSLAPKSKPDESAQSNKRRMFKNKIRRNVILEDRLHFHLSPTQSTTEVVPRSLPTHVTRSLSGPLPNLEDLKHKDPRQPDSPKSSRTSLSPTNRPTRATASPLKPVNGQEPFQSIFHPSLNLNKLSGDCVTLTDRTDNKENEAVDHSDDDVEEYEEDDEVEDEQIGVQTAAGDKKVKRRRKNRQQRLRKKARRH